MHITVNDTRLFFDVEGAKLVPDGPTMREKPSLILLHGGPGVDHSLYKPTFSAFADIAQVIYLDLRGQGRSARSSPDYWRLSTWADDLRAFCDALAIEKPIVLGESAGGWVALAYATRYPEHPGKLILASTSARQSLGRILAAFERLGGKDAQEAARVYLEMPNLDTWKDYARICLPLYFKTQQDPNKLLRSQRNPELLFFFFSHELKTMNFLPALAQVQCPTLVLAGEEDPITPAEDVEDIVSALPPHLVRFERFADPRQHGVSDGHEQSLQMIREFILDDRSNHRLIDANC
jgi:pimeloyl-ACP methyl ester carboxylesterase